MRRRVKGEQRVAAELSGQRKRKLQLLPPVLIRQNEEAKAGAFAYAATRAISVWMQMARDFCGLGCAGFFVKPRGRLLLPDVRIFGRDILAGIFSH